MTEHPLAAILRDAASGDGRNPSSSETCLFLPPLEGPVDAVCAFTGWSAVAIGLPEREMRERIDGGDLLGPMQATFLAWAARRLATSPGSVDAVLVAPETVPPDAVGLVLRHDLGAHPRVRRAGLYRREISVHADRSGAALLVLGRGLAGRWEMSFEVAPGGRRLGLGRAVAAAAPGLVPPGEPLFAQVAPGNAASLRAVLSAGYRPIGAECLLLRPPVRRAGAGIVGPG